MWVSCNLRPLSVAFPAPVFNVFLLVSRASLGQKRWDFGNFDQTPGTFFEKEKRVFFFLEKSSRGLAEIQRF